MTSTIRIVRVGSALDEDTMRSLLDDIRKIFEPLSCDLSKEVLPLPLGSYNVIRKQHLSTRILELASTVISSGDKSLLVTDVDLYVPNMNFVFGEALCPGDVAIVSIHRMASDAHSGNNRSKVNGRLAKEAVHELGHTFDLRHCDNPKCVMHFSRSLADTDLKEKTFCERCRNCLLSCIAKQG